MRSEIGRGTTSQNATLAAQQLAPENSGNQKSLFELYDSMFECIIANTDELIDACYKLRYQVYCLEHEFEEPNPELGEYERDEFDPHAIHALLRHRQTGEFIGTVRLIVADKNSPIHIPAFQVCAEHNIELPKHMYEAPCAEISRFCIAKNFRRRVTDNIYGSSYSPREMAEFRARIVPFMALGMMAMVFKICADNGIRQATAVVEPTLIRLLDKLGIHFNPVGQPIEYHGTRQVTYIKDDELLASLRVERPDVYELMMQLR